MKKKWDKSVWSLLAILGGASVQAGEAVGVDSLAAALQEGEIGLSFRLRHEQVADDVFARDANASTLRGRLSWNSAPWRGWELAAEVDHVAYLFDGRYNDTRNGKTGFPVVVDPTGTDLNRFSLGWQGEQVSVVAGRQRILLDNQRFVGGVGWRQNEQTYDALRLALQPLTELQIDYTWVEDTRRIFGPERGTPPASLDSDHHLLNIAWRPGEAIGLTGYAYQLDFGREAPGLSSRTLGGYLLGRVALDGLLADELVLDYRLELARQEDAGNNPVKYSAGFSHLGAGLSWRGWRLGVAREVLGADRDAGVALQTPLATLHAFQGWADKFLSTPAAGLEDRFVGVSGQLAGVTLQATWHHYQADTGDSTFGREWNLQASRQFAGRYTLTLKYADYRADDFSRDTRKLWLVAEAGF
ncbi:hypothetical protein [Haliea atlantica]|mgnify:CR=1 FL=1|nr:hypothetical protein [Haliea sp.]|tara:strand:+ start:270 stop:1511 length:1242 start_codon:yes stop_codon:yes gene_type:complete